MRLTGFLLIAVLILAPSRSWAEEDLAKLSGYVDFSSLGLSKKSESSVEVYLKGPLLKLVSEASRDEDPELGRMLAKLKLIRVEVFPLSSQEREQVEAQVAQTTQRLEEQGWEKVVRVREADEQTRIYLKTEGEVITGLLVVTIEAKEGLTFVNLVGDIDPSELGRLGGKFNIPPLDSMRADKGRQ
ncbi:MAG: DUF4252 domain-containing protein [Candidatus Latescibacteria bacterium]|nr:DUF4252 domain-containing protein [Candidatus Latescibacterota bacterium]